MVRCARSAREFSITRDAYKRGMVASWSRRDAARGKLDWRMNSRLQVLKRPTTSAFADACPAREDPRRRVLWRDALEARFQSPAPRPLIKCDLFTPRAGSHTSACGVGAGRARRPSRRRASRAGPASRACAAAASGAILAEQCSPT